MEAGLPRRQGIDNGAPVPLPGSKSRAVSGCLRHPTLTIGPLDMRWVRNHDPESAAGPRVHPTQVPKDGVCKRGIVHTPAAVADPLTGDGARRCSRPRCHDAQITAGSSST
ncbi:hypothetical protein NDU88_001490 [Pleurodeles waltl]|uniref:Uncharacterized protein n=1 Tax=Pleurodeles waltl TaxID=8319 RepID=A0AAV7KR38_PLEWA|nr:hypothetical protein NDU88_001490 [Pleurodeles waltl]